MENITVNMENLTEEEREQLLKLVEKGNRKDGIFDIKYGDIYYLIGIGGKVHESCFFGPPDKDIMKIGNACKSERYMKKLALREQLNRKLWQYSWEHEGDKIRYDDFDPVRGGSKYYIGYDAEQEDFKVKECINFYTINTPMFYSHHTAEKAIEDVVEPFLADNGIGRYYTDLFYTGENKIIF